MARRPLIAAVLPPNEGFSPEASGAIGLVVQRLSTGDPDFEAVVVGAPLRYSPFPAPPFQAAALPPWLPASRAVRYGWGVAGLLRRLSPDAVEVHNRPRLALALARRLPGTPVSLVLHNDPQGMAGMARPAGRAALGGLARVMAVSPYVRDRLLEGVAGPWMAAPAVVPNGIELGDLPPPSTVRDPLILFAGRLVREKGAERFVAACARALPHLPGWRAAVIGARRLRPGDAPDAYSAAVRDAAGRAGVEMAGHQPHTAVLAAMARAAIVVVPSLWPEPFGLTALEAMASGAALLCSPTGNLPALVGDAAWLVDPADPEALAAAMVTLAGDGGRRAALGEAGRRRAREFHLSRSVAALGRVRWGMLGGRPGASSLDPTKA